MNRHLFRSLCVLMFSLILGIPGQARAATGRVHGTITDQTGAALRGATVEVRAVDSRFPTIDGLGRRRTVCRRGAARGALPGIGRGDRIREVVSDRRCRGPPAGTPSSISCWRITKQEVAVDVTAPRSCRRAGCHRARESPDQRYGGTARRHPRREPPRRRRAVEPARDSRPGRRPREGARERHVGRVGLQQPHEPAALLHRSGEHRIDRGHGRHHAGEPRRRQHRRHRDGRLAPADIRSGRRPSAGSGQSLSATTAATARPTVETRLCRSPHRA